MDIIKQDEMLKMQENLLNGIKKYEKLIKDFDGRNNELNGKIQEVSEVSSLIDENKKETIRELKKQSNQMVSSFRKEVEQAKNEIRSTADEVKEIHKQMKIDMNSFKELLTEFQNTIRSFDADSETAEEDDNIISIERDYDDIDTIDNLWDKYYIAGEPFIVVKNNWRNDYCFSVNSIENGYAYGNRYLRGQYYNNDRCNANQKDFHLYNGPSYEIIREAEGYNE